MEVRTNFVLSGRCIKSFVSLERKHVVPHWLYCSCHYILLTKNYMNNKVRGCAEVQL